MPRGPKRSRCPAVRAPGAPRRPPASNVRIVTGMRPHRLEQRAIGPDLRVLGFGVGVRGVEQELGSVQADALRAGVADPAHLLGNLEIGFEPHAHAVGRGGGPGAEVAECAQAGRGDFRPLLPPPERGLRRLDHHFARRAVERHHLAGQDHFGGAAEPDDRGDAERSQRITV